MGNEIKNVTKTCVYDISVKATGKRLETKASKL